MTSHTVKLDGGNVTGIVLLEGANAHGKSWLAKAFASRVKHVQYFHCDYRNFKNRMFHYHLATLHKAARASSDRLAVIDRNWLSEEIYAHFYRGGTPWPHEGRVLSKLIRKHAVLNILCSTSP